jgi:hypothetical protein
VWYQVTIPLTVATTWAFSGNLSYYPAPDTAAGMQTDMDVIAANGPAVLNISFTVPAQGNPLDENFSIDNVQLTEGTSSTPEPSTWLLLPVGLGLIALGRRYCEVYSDKIVASAVNLQRVSRKG